MDRMSLFQSLFNCRYQDKMDVEASLLIQEVAEGILEKKEKPDMAKITKALRLKNVTNDKEKHQIISYVTKKPEEVISYLNACKQYYDKDKKFYEDDPIGIAEAKKNGWMTEAEWLESLKPKEYSGSKDFF